MEKRENKKTVNIIISVLLTGLVIILVFFYDRIFGLSQSALKDKIESYGTFAPIVFFIVQFLQVIISPIPGNITTMAGGAIFGFGKAFLISSAAIILGAIAGFALARKFGKPLVIRIVGKENTEKYLDTLSNTKTKKLIFILVMLLPFFPDDIICFIAGLTEMKWIFYLSSIIITRPIGLLIAAFIGSRGLTYEPWMWITMAAVFILTIVLSLGIFRYIDNHK